MTKTLAFGVSLKPNRYSNLAVKKLVANKIETVAFGLKEGEVAGVTVVTDPKNFTDIHTITLYINASKQKEYYQTIIALNPQRVIFNPGTENPEFYKLLQDAGIEVEAACTLVLLSTNQY